VVRYHLTALANNSTHMPTILGIKEYRGLGDWGCLDMVKCFNCGSDTDNPRFCSRNCSTTTTNKENPRRKKKIRVLNECKNCGGSTTNKTYCSYFCRFGKPQPPPSKRMGTHVPRIRIECLNCGTKTTNKKYCSTICMKVAGKQKPGSLWKDHSKEEKSLARRAYRYGATWGEIEELFEGAGDVCKICKKWKPDCIDHSHITGKIRGLICSRCNTALGFVDDNVETLRRAIEYLNENN